MAPSPESHRMFWTMPVGDACIWSIVSTEQTTYTFYVPPYSTTNTNPNEYEPYAPFPTVNRLLPPGMSTDHGLAKFNHQYTSTAEVPLVTLYGKNFVKRSDGRAHHAVYYGETPATYNEVRCSEVMASSEPSLKPKNKDSIFLVRHDGQCILPTGLTYP